MWLLHVYHFEELPLISKEAAQFYIPPNSIWGFKFPHILFQHLLLCVFDCSHPGGSNRLHNVISSITIIPLKTRFIYLFIFREGRGGRKTSMCERNVDPATFPLVGCHPTNWATLVRARLSFLNRKNNFLFLVKMKGSMLFHECVFSSNF